MTQPTTRPHQPQAIGARLSLPAAASAQTVIAVAFSLMLGLGLLTVAGFAHATHDVAHDARHAFAVPCH